MSRTCIDLNYCLGCGYPVGLENKECNCYCHLSKEWTDGAEILHKIDVKGNETISYIDEYGEKVVHTITKAQFEDIGSVFDMGNDKKQNIDDQKMWESLTPREKKEKELRGLLELLGGFIDDPVLWLDDESLRSTIEVMQKIIVDILEKDVEMMFRGEKVKVTK